ncbi:hypothetical protein ACFCY8_21300 [Streptomyces noursei]|uniref:hypothetical protein n=1 Tax=Streptomyces noursei TaxID=1971 RepID=UPI0035DC30C6
MRALTENAHPIDRPSADNGLAKVPPPPRPYGLPDGEGSQEGMDLYATCGLRAGGVAVAVIAGATVVWRDARR